MEWTIWLFARNAPWAIVAQLGLPVDYLRGCSMEWREWTIAKDWTVHMCDGSYHGFFYGFFLHTHSRNLYHLIHLFCSIESHENWFSRRCAIQHQGRYWRVVLWVYCIHNRDHVFFVWSLALWIVSIHRIEYCRYSDSAKLFMEIIHFLTSCITYLSSPYHSVRRGVAISEWGENEACSPETGNDSVSLIIQVANSTLRPRHADPLLRNVHY